MKTDDRAIALSSMSWTITKMFSGGGDKFADGIHSYNRIISGYWSYDGVWIDPGDCKNTANEVHVVAFRGARPLAVNAFGVDRGFDTASGGVKIGEVVYYDRALTSQERRDTELYLLKKWKGNVESHPQDALLAANSTEVVYKKDSAATINVDAGENVNTVLRLASEIVKTGDGTLDAVVSPITANSIAAKGGALNIKAKVLLDAAFHADATDLSSMTYAIDDNSQTNILTWSGAKAVTWFWGTPSKPRLTAFDVNGNGHTMPFVDTLRVATNQNYTPESVAGGAGMIWPNLGPLQEFYIVLKDKSEGQPYMEIIGFDKSDVSSNARFPFLRQSNPQILNADWSSGDLWKGYVGLDGNKVSPSTHLDNDVHLITFSALNPITNVFCFSRRESYRIGGQLIGECAAFPMANTAEVRTKIENYLRKKWLNANINISEADFFDLSAITLANDAKISFEDNGMVKAGTISGSGTITFSNEGGIKDVSSILLGYRNTDDYDALKIDGTFDVAQTGTATVTVDLPDNAKSSNLINSPVAVLSATKFANFDNFSNWNLIVATTSKGKVKPRLHIVEGTGLVLDFISTVTRVIVR